MTFTHISWSQLREFEDTARTLKASRMQRGATSQSQEDVQNIGPTGPTGPTDRMQDEEERSDSKQDAA